ncbi:cupin domain-containing protein [Solihabitans fulvus]|uniref:Cupin domain-containing protein n=1 Tax=Solihabitans fulvus TaxID=1892852 RepID=A0A5B2WT02_9PSEU|nr:cysteine dioxygenase family protein [Solihabitans fulvus]KAA2253539.1 cupin domain-containing protein [Solihabitans fulvus]
MFAVPENTVALPAARAVSHPALVAARFAQERQRWAHLLRYDPDTRFSALVERTEEQEVWLMSWLPGQQTDLHDHGGESGAFTVVSGALTELVAHTDGAGRAVEVLHRVVAGQSRVFGPNYVHQVSNEGPDPAVTLHVYRAERRMTSYRFDPVDGPRAVGPERGAAPRTHGSS